jgi:hypothetical protein
VGKLKLIPENALLLPFQMAKVQYYSSSFGHFFVLSPNYESLVFKAFLRLLANPGTTAPGLKLSRHVTEQATLYDSAKTKAVHDAC